MILGEAPSPNSVEFDPVHASETDAIEAYGDHGPRSGPLGGDVMPWVVSGAREQSLRDQAVRLVRFLEENDDLRVCDIGYSLAVGRSAFEHRAVVVGAERSELSAGLRALAEASPALDLVEGVVPAAGPGRVVFIFPGQGSQWAGMAVELLERSPVFADRIGECERALAPFVDWSLQSVLRGLDGAPGLDRVDVVQPALFAVMVSLARLWEACGVVPDVVMGHSQGEIAAACVAGMLSLEQAARVSALRGRALLELAGLGGMASLGLGCGETEALLGSLGGELSVAAVNGSASVVVSGGLEELARLLEACERRGVRARKIAVDYAAHSRQVEEIREMLLDGCADLTSREGTVRLLSTVTAETLTGAELDANYWYRNLREPVLFERAVRSLVAEGAGTFIEMSPHPVLTIGMRDTVDGFPEGLPPAGDAPSEHPASVVGGGGEVGLIGSLRRDQGGPRRFLLSLSEAWSRGVEVNWEAVFAGAGSRRVQLPTYAFQRERYRLEPSMSGPANVTSLGMADAEHPLLGAATELAGGRGWLFTGSLSPQTHPWLADHALGGTALLAGTAFLELALYAGTRSGCEIVQELALQAPLVFAEGAAQVQVVVGEAGDDGSREIGIHSRAQAASGGSQDEQLWICHATGTLAREEPPQEHAAAEGHAEQGQSPQDLESGERLSEVGLGGSWPPVGAVELPIEDLYGPLSEVGLEYGSAFKGLQAVWRRGEELFAEVALPEEHRAEAGAFSVHPALLDAALHTIALTELAGTDTGKERRGVRLPFEWAGVRMISSGASRLRVRLCRLEQDAISLELANELGMPVGSVNSLAARPLLPEQLVGLRGEHHESMLRLKWAPLAQSALGAAWDLGPWAVLGGDAAPGVETLTELGASATAHEDLPALVAALEEGLSVPQTVLVQCGGESDGRDLVEAAHASARQSLALVQEWLSEERLANARLVLVTQGAVSANADEDVLDLAGAPIWGLIRVAQAENPDRFVLLDSDGGEESWTALVGGLASGQPQLALRDGQILAPKLERIPTAKPVFTDGRIEGSRSEGGTGAGKDGESGVGSSESASAVTSFDPRGTVLITGGLAGIGKLLARHLVVEHGVRSLVLAGRRGPTTEGAEELERELLGLGARVTVAACDVSDRQALAALIENVPKEYPLRGIVHSAVVLDDGVIGSLTPERIDRVLSAKVDGTVHLHELTKHMDLSAFVLFSSAVGTVGSAGQANYAAANAFLDAFAAHRRSMGLPGLSIAWGMWTPESTMTGLGPDRRLSERAERTGILPFSPEEGLEQFDLACSSAETLVVPLRLNPTALTRQLELQALPPIFSGLVKASARRMTRVAAGWLARRLRALPAEERAELALEVVRAEVAVLLGHPSEQAVDPRRAFSELGFDSLAAVELRNRLALITSLRLPSTLVFSYPNCVALSEYLIESIGGDTMAETPPAQLELDRLERAISSVSLDEDGRARIESRLRLLLAGLSTASQADASSAGVENIESASADEMIELIDRQLGIA